MPIYLGGETKEIGRGRNLDDLTPRQIVEELDKYVVGQSAAKRAVAVALRNRIRRQKLPPEIAQDVLPKNILMIGSTGVGKTEIARRLARVADSPFIKIEASKFTEVGYVGRDVESIIRELTEVAVDMTKQAAYEEVRERAEENAEHGSVLVFRRASCPRPLVTRAANYTSAGKAVKSDRVPVLLWCGRPACIAFAIEDAPRFSHNKRDAGGTPAPQENAGYSAKTNRFLYRQVVAAASSISAKVQAAP